MQEPWGPWCNAQTLSSSRESCGLHASAWRRLWGLSLRHLVQIWPSSSPSWVSSRQLHLHFLCPLQRAGPRFTQRLALQPHLALHHRPRLHLIIPKQELQLRLRQHPGISRWTGEDELCEAILSTQTRPFARTCNILEVNRILKLQKKILLWYSVNIWFCRKWEIMIITYSGNRSQREAGHHPLPPSENRHRGLLQSILGQRWPCPPPPPSHRPPKAPAPPWPLALLLDPHPTSPSAYLPCPSCHVSAISCSCTPCRGAHHCRRWLLPPGPC